MDAANMSTKVTPINENENKPRQSNLSEAAMRIYQNASSQPVLVSVHSRPAKPRHSAPSLLTMRDRQLTCGTEKLSLDDLIPVFLAYMICYGEVCCYHGSRAAVSRIRGQSM